MSTEGVPFWDKKIRSSNRRPTGDLIPSTSWGSSLANLLKASQWQEMRLEAIARAGHCCELCGVDEREGSLEGHEMWSYRAPTAPEDGEVGLQSLNDVIAVCKECHGCFHLGFAQVRGIEKVVLARLQRLNGWSDQTLKKYEKNVWGRWDRFSQTNWILNLNGWSVGEGFVLKSGPVRVEGSEFALQTKNDTITGIVGAKYRLANETEWSFHACEDTDEAISRPRQSVE